MERRKILSSLLEGNSTSGDEFGGRKHRFRRREQGEQPILRRTVTRSAQNTEYAAELQRFWSPSTALKSDSRTSKCEFSIIPLAHTPEPSQTEYRCRKRSRVAAVSRRSIRNSGKCEIEHLP
ncbi:unnamed protein product [Mycena citricolor]|uniref:Uncharacterized protein n=1 Tax=Mycena citricolor TaxID=2018698 RepID=A0AAD2H2E1_9AGAR|nr:unnamed protein product [Mycena citricolor]